jgi:hypothetical protein
VDENPEISPFRDQLILQRGDVRIHSLKNYGFRTGKASYNENPVIMPDPL